MHFRLDSTSPMVPIVRQSVSQSKNKTAVSEANQTSIAIRLPGACLSSTVADVYRRYSLVMQPTAEPVTAYWHKLQTDLQPCGSLWAQRSENTKKMIGEIFHIISFSFLQRNSVSWDAGTTNYQFGGVSLLTRLLNLLLGSDWFALPIDLDIISWIINEMRHFLWTQNIKLNNISPIFVYQILELSLQQSEFIKSLKRYM